MSVVEKNRRCECEAVSWSLFILVELASPSLLAAVRHDLYCEALEVLRAVPPHGTRRVNIERSACFLWPPPGGKNNCSHL